MQLPRVIIEYELAPHNKWCWLPEWYSGSDSAYCLLAKFSRLNVLTIREICEIFVEPNAKNGVNVGRGHPHYPIVDLRFTKNISIGRMSTLMKLDPGSLQSGFLDTLFPTASRGAATHLKWCSTCALRGFHSVVFQLDFVHFCPLHNTALTQRCKKCSSHLPYQLHAPGGGTLFCCSCCGTDMAPNLRTPKHSFVLSSEAASSLASHIDLIRFADQLPTLIAKCRTTVGSPYMPIVLSKPDSRQRVLSFRHFVANVLTAVSRTGVKEAQTEMELLPPVSTFLEPRYSVPRLLASTKKLKRESGDSIAKDSDVKLNEATLIYKAIRRHFWRHHVCKHRACARRAMKSFWWDLEGEQATVFCKTALAFIRWRMQWEGRRIPARMTGSPERSWIAYGLLGWIFKDAPVPSMYWSKRFESWLNANLLAAACFDSFRGWITRCALDEKKLRFIWESGCEKKFQRRHWACSGRGSESEPGLVFLEPMTEATLQLDELAPFNRQHFSHTCEIIKTLKR